jgi:hypothetical protein
MKAKLALSTPSKNSKTGWTHKYIITGTKEELDKFVKTQNFLDYPLHDEVTGEPIVFRNEPMLSDPCDVGINPKNNMHYLSDAAIIANIARVSKLEKMSQTMANAMAQETVAEIRGVSRFRSMSIPDAEVKEETKE